MNTMTPKGASQHSFDCETGVRKSLSRFKSSGFQIESAAQSNSVISDSEAQLGQLPVRSDLLSVTSLAACLSYAVSSFCQPQCMPWSFRATVMWLQNAIIFPTSRL